MSVFTFKVWEQAEHLMFEELTHRTRSAFAEMHPKDRPDAMVVMHPLMRNLIERSVAQRLTPSPPETVDPLRELTERPKVDRLFGMPLETYPFTDWTAVEVRAENAHDRAFRRAQERGQAVNVVKFEEFPMPPLPSAPTFKALAAHWLRKITWRKL